MRRGSLRLPRRERGPLSPLFYCAGLSVPSYVVPIATRYPCILAMGPSQLSSVLFYGHTSHIGQANVVHKTNPWG